MGEYTYNTGHGHFRLLEANKDIVREKLSERFAKKFDSVAEALEHIGFETEEDTKGDIIDIFLKSSFASDEDWDDLKLVVGRHVEAGSRLVFFTQDHCYAVCFDDVECDAGTVRQGYEEDVETVTHSDLFAMLDVVKEHNPALWTRLSNDIGLLPLEDVG